MRHGQAEAYASSDEARCLTSRGQAEALAAGRTLAALDVVFDAVWVSPFQRAQQTADQVLKSIEVGDPSINYEYLFADEDGRISQSANFPTNFD